MRFAHFFRGFMPLPRSDRKSDPMRLLGDDLNLIEFKLDGGLAAEHRNNYADRIFVDLHAFHHAGEGAQRTVENLYGIANSVADDNFLLQCMKVKSEVAQSCLTLSDPMDCSLPGSSVHGIFQARVLEWSVKMF